MSAKISAILMNNHDLLFFYYRAPSSTSTGGSIIYNVVQKDKIKSLAAALMDHDIFLAISDGHALAYVDEEGEDPFICAFTSVRKLERFIKKIDAGITPAQCDPLLTNMGEYYEDLRGDFGDLEIMIDPDLDEVLKIHFIPRNPRV
ncbi:MAG: hypothetical protein KDK27_17605 [Leptospiraceae bacterium]|nr:hypothetical protein [Leptospiraceae bacterium]